MTSPEEAHAHLEICSKPDAPQRIALSFEHHSPRFNTRCRLCCVALSLSHLQTFVWLSECDSVLTSELAPEWSELLPAAAATGSVTTERTSLVYISCVTANRNAAASPRGVPAHDLLLAVRTTAKSPSGTTTCKAITCPARPRRLLNLPFLPSRLGYT